MSDNKKSIVVKKSEAEAVMKQLEEQKAEEPNIQEEPKVNEVVEEKSKATKSVKSAENTFAEKSAEAAATAALKAAITTNNEMAIKEAEKAYFNDKKNHMLNKCKTDRVVTRRVSKLFAPYLGRTYTFLYNCVPVTIYCDDKEHEYPEFIANKIDEKLAKISESNTYKEIIDERLEQDTF